jgi:hypothetical protein
MAMVTLMITGRSYQVACKDGEEETLRAAARLVDAKSREAISGMGTWSTTGPRPPPRRHSTRLSPIAPMRSPTGSKRSPTALRKRARTPKLVMTGTARCAL